MMQLFKNNTQNKIKMTEKTKILIVEDEAIIAESIKMTIESLGYEVVAIANNALDAIEILNTNTVDLAIIDINIQGDKNGIWLAQNMFKNKPFIYLTAYGDDKTIQQAIQTKPSGYLLKPFKKVNISTAIQIALVNYTSGNVADINTDGNIDKNLELLQSKETVFIKQKDSYIKLTINDILFIESDKNYLKIQTENETITIRNTLKEISKNLPVNFVQTHRSFIVNIQHINKIQSYNIKVGSFLIPLSSTHKKDLLSIIETLN